MYLFCIYTYILKKSYYFNIEVYIHYMNNVKEAFLKSFLPESTKEMYFSQINLDITDLSLADILRNLNTLYPPNTRNRNAVENGDLVLGVLCRTETLDPYNGVVVFVCGKDVEINIASCNYIILAISEDRIRNDDLILQLLADITDFLIKNYSISMSNLPDFYRKFVYDESEMEDESDDYRTEGY